MFFISKISLFQKMLSWNTKQIVEKSFYAASPVRKPPQVSYWETEIAPTKGPDSSFAPFPSKNESKSSICVLGISLRL